jgi:hypothetical protein
VPDEDLRSHAQPLPTGVQQDPNAAPDMIDTRYWVREFPVHRSTLEM